MSKFVIRQYSLVIFSLVIYGLMYTLYELQYVNNIYSIINGLNSTENMSYGLGDFFIKINHFEDFIFAIHIIKLFALIILIWSKTRFTGLFLLLVIGVIHMCLNIHTISPEQPYLNFLYLCLIFIKDHRPHIFSNKELILDIPDNLYFVVSVVGYTSYTASGSCKLFTSEWQDGTFLKFFIESNHLVLDWVKFLLIPQFYYILKLVTYLTLFLEFGAILSLVNPYIKFLIWIGLFLMHFSLILISDIWQVSFGMLIFHLMLIDQETINIVLKRWMNLKVEN